MKFKDIKEILNAEVLTENFDGNLEVNYAFASDLMSDVLAYSNNDTLLITGLNNPQVVRTAEMMDIPIVVFVRGKLPSKETIDLANENSLTVLSSEYIMFKACALLCENGMKGFE